MLLRDEILAAVDGLTMRSCGTFPMRKRCAPVALSPDEERALAEAEAEVARAEVVPLLWPPAEGY